MTAAEKVDVYDIITETVVKALEDGTVPWRQPWATAGLPVSLSTKKPYRGINVFLLGFASFEGGYTSPWWGTFKKIKESGGSVRKGEKSTVVTFWKTYARKARNEDTGKDENKQSFYLRYYRVFNSEQADWAEGKAPVVAENPSTPAERDAAADAIVGGYEIASLTYGGDRAYYVPGTDSVVVPPLESYGSTSEFYSTLFHELSHSTGHSTRLNRPGTTTFTHFGSDLYAKEELVAELGAALLLGVTGLDVPKTIENSGAYLRNWLTALKGDKKLIVHAAAQAQRAADCVRGIGYGEKDDPETSVEVEAVPELVLVAA